ncbi:MAG: hypothetical protein JOZ52_03610 [Acidobacteria bacterium]|nr:hypothetical protein [Acidobacteriota bacterium]
MQREARLRDVLKMQNIEYGGRARVTVVGVLRNKSRRDFMWYHYRFDILGFEEIAHVVVPYEGALQAGTTYRASVRGDRRRGLSLVPQVRMQEHYALLVEWTNLKEFPALKRLRDGSGQQQIVFSVISDEIKQIDVMRWNRTIQCKIIRVE